MYLHSRNVKILLLFSFASPSKSSLLSAILGELSRAAGVVKVKGELTYTSQQPWILPGTIRSNILFGKPLNPLKYSRVLKACALKRVRITRCGGWVFYGTWAMTDWFRLCLNPGQDVELLPGGDLTVVGDRGANLSGGQKARVSLARCAGYRCSISSLCCHPKE